MFNLGKLLLQFRDAAILKVETSEGGQRWLDSSVHFKTVSSAGHKSGEKLHKKQFAKCHVTVQTNVTVLEAIGFLSFQDQAAASVLMSHSPLTVEALPRPACLHFC